MSAPGRDGRADAAERQRRGGHLHGVASGGPGGGDAQFHRRPHQPDRRLPRGRDPAGADLARLRREGRTRRGSSRRSVGSPASSGSRTCGRARRGGTSSRRADRGSALRQARAGRSGGGAVHVRHRGRAQGRRVVARQHSRQLRPGRRPLRSQDFRHLLQPAADVPRLRPDRRDACSG